jgi:hypothetical protein
VENTPSFCNAEDAELTALCLELTGWNYIGVGLGSNLGRIHRFMLMLIVVLFSSLRQISVNIPIRP